MNDDQSPRSKRLKTDNESDCKKKKLIIVIEDCSLEIGKVNYFFLFIYIFFFKFLGRKRISNFM